MSVVIHHAIPMEPRFEVELPLDARIINVDYVPWISSPAMWVLMDPGKPKVTRRFRIIGTGNNAPDRLSSYVGTWLDASVVDDEKVWHLFEDRRSR